MSRHQDADSVRLIMTRGNDRILCIVDPSFVPLLVMLAAKDHHVMEKKWLDRESRYVWVNIGRRAAIIDQLELEIESTDAMELEEFVQRQAGTFKEKARGPRGLRELLSSLGGVEIKLEEEKGPSLN